MDVEEMVVALWKNKLGTSVGTSAMGLVLQLDAYGLRKIKLSEGATFDAWSRRDSKRDENLHQVSYILCTICLIFARRRLLCNKARGRSADSVYIA